VAGFFFARKDFLKTAAASLTPGLIGESHASGDYRMGRILVIALACMVSALGVWLLVPTVGPVPVNKDLPAFEYDPDPAPKADTTAPKAGVITEEKRRLRAEQLIGKTMKYIVSSEVHSASWFTEQGSPVIERAMDECYLLSDPELYPRHVAALDGGEDPGEYPSMEAILAASSRPMTIKQTQNCMGAARAYAQLHGLNYDF
jgi:hypothetical protein